MSKAALIMDMPESCDMCDFTDMVNGEMYCGVPGCGELAEDYICSRPDWGPLRELPEQTVDAITGGETKRPDWRQRLMSRFERVR